MLLFAVCLQPATTFAATNVYIPGESELLSNRKIKSKGETKMKNRTMKLKATLFLGICLAILAVAASPAYARSTTGFSAFHVLGPIGSDPYNCLSEQAGAVVNECGYPVSLEFDLPVDATGTYYVQVQDYFQGTAQNTFQCATAAYPGNGTYTWGTFINFTGPLQTLTSSVSVSAAESIQFFCWNIPSGGGIANINWWN